jgi:hypothetical protein
LVHIAEAPSGTQRWEGRILAKSTVPGDDIYVDCLMLFPVDDGYGELKVEPSVSSLTTVSAHDEFNQTAGNLDVPKALPVGGNWSEAGKVGAEGWKVNAGLHKAERAVVSDPTPSGSYAIAGTTSAANQQVSALFSSTALPAVESQLGVLGRYVSTTNWFKAVLRAESMGGPFAVTLNVYKEVGGVLAAPIPSSVRVLEGVTSFANLAVTLTIFSSGVWRAESGGKLLEGYEPDLATGGALAAGKAGIFDEWNSPTACVRTADNFSLYTGTADAAVYASRSAEIRASAVFRQDVTGAVVSPRTDYKGAYFRPPPARREARALRTIVKLSRGNIDTLPDVAIDDASFKILSQSRGLVLPES